VRLSIRARLTLWYALLLAVIVVAVGVFLLLRLRSDLVRGMDESLSTRAAQIALGFSGQGGGQFQDVADISLAGLPQAESGAQLLDSGGRLLESSGDAIAERPLVGPEALARALAGTTIRETVGTGSDREPFRVLAIRLPGPGAPSVVVVATSLEETNRSIGRLAVLLLAAVPVALAAAAAGGWWLARAALRPVARMTKAASEIGAGTLDERIDVPAAADELQRLASTLNAMLERLQAAVEQKRRFVGDASHELRSPLAVMRTELDVTLTDPSLPPAAREALASVDEEVTRMSRLVDDLLVLARIDEGGLPLLLGRIDLREVAENAVSSMRVLAGARGIELSLEGSPAPTEADAARIEQVIVNLVGNAVKFTGLSGKVGVEVWSDEGGVGLTVRDTGPGIAPDLLPTIFDRFVRADPARSRAEGGSGLGLAICHEIVHAHGGRIWVESEPGRGSAFSFRIPSKS
jgi:heavy metal sensor kinase